VIAFVRRHRVVTGLVLLVLAAFAWLWTKSVPDLPRAVLEAKYATPPSQFVTLAPGTRVHYRGRGRKNAPVLLLLHGFSGSLFVWEGWSHDLSDRYRVISLDLPGSGLTGAVADGDYSQGAMTAFVKAFADKLGLKRFVLAGNSMGGGIAARFAETWPERVSALILLDAPLPAGRRYHTRTYLANVPLLSDLYLFLAPPGELNRMEGTRGAMLEHFRLADDDFVWRHVGAIHAPTLILWGKEDRTIPLPSAYVWAKAVPGSRLVVVPHAGHVPMIGAPAVTSGAARAFLDSMLH
jgi:pimeloyl-ACP methyl ester carboxylesterase